MIQTFHSPQSLITWDVRAPLAMAAQSVLSGLLICTTPKDAVVIRAGSLPVLLALAVVCVRTASAFSLQAMLYLGFAVCGYVNVFHCVNMLCLHPIDDAYVRREMAKWKQEYPANPRLLSRVIFTTGMLFSFRGVGTAHEIRSMPRFSGGVVPTKTSFLLQQVTWIAFEYLFMDFIVSQPQPPEAAKAWELGKEWLWLPLNSHPVTRADLTGRAIGTLMSWYLFGQMMLDIWYRIFSVVWVGLGISPVVQWPPMYGPRSQCYSLRRYFNVFWHQCLRAPLQGTATFVTRKLLGLGPSLLQSYLNMLIVFMLSGHFHILLDWCSGMTSWRLSGALACFTLFVPTIMAEDAFQWAWHKLKRKAGLRPDDLGLVETAFGFLWTFLALAVVTPVFNYPLQRVPTKSNPQYVIPWSFFGPDYGGTLSR